VPPSELELGDVCDRSGGKKRAAPDGLGPLGVFGLLSRGGLVDGDGDRGRTIGRCRRRHDRKRGCAS
jgi:hypothetical protein